MELLNWVEILMLFGTLQGGLLIIVINRFSRRHKTANQILTIFLIIIILNSSWEIWKLTDEVVVMDAIRNITFFLYGPLYYLYFQSLLTTKVINKKRWLVYLLPSLIYTVLIFFILKIPDLWYSSWVVTALVILTHGLIYVIKSYQLVTYYRNKTFNAYRHLKYLQTTILLIAISLFLALIVLLLFGTAHYVDLLNRYLAGIIGSFIIYSLAYFVVLFPEVFRLPVEKPCSEISTSVTVKQHFSKDELQIWKTKLEKVMTSSQLYLIPGLTLSDIAKLMEVDNLMVSRVIHEGFQLNFNEFVNAYRIDHFIQLSQDKNYQHYTILALAYEAGFNAKSTFHKVFKKVKNMTPTAYLKLLDES